MPLTGYSTPALAVQRHDWKKWSRCTCPTKPANQVAMLQEVEAAVAKAMEPSVKIGFIAGIAAAAFAVAAGIAAIFVFAAFRRRKRRRALKSAKAATGGEQSADVTGVTRGQASVPTVRCAFNANLQAARFALTHVF